MWGVLNRILTYPFVYFDVSYFSVTVRIEHHAARRHHARTVHFPERYAMPPSATFWHRTLTWSTWMKILEKMTNLTVDEPQPDAGEDAAQSIKACSLLAGLRLKRSAVSAVCVEAEGKEEEVRGSQGHPS